MRSGRKEGAAAACSGGEDAEAAEGALRPERRSEKGSKQAAPAETQAAEAVLVEAAQASRVSSRLELRRAED